MPRQREPRADDFGTNFQRIDNVVLVPFHDEAYYLKNSLTRLKDCATPTAKAHEISPFFNVQREPLICVYCELFLGCIRRRQRAFHHLSFRQ